MAKLTAKMDTRALLSSLKKEAKRFGESTRNATARMGLQAARELSKNTQVYGADWNATQDRQRNAIIGDMRNVFVIVSRKSRGVIATAGDAVRELDKHREGRKKRTVELHKPIPITQAAFTGAMAIAFRRAGMAKSAWIGTARHLERKQGDGQQIKFGKAYTAQLRKWESMGKGTEPKGDFKPSVELHNTAKHTAFKYVLSDAKIRNAQKWAVIKTLKWYEKAATKNLAKNKPKT